MGCRLACPLCGSHDAAMVARVPWSTNGLVPEQQLYMECERCGHQWQPHTCLID